MRLLVVLCLFFGFNPARIVISQETTCGAHPGDDSIVYASTPDDAQDLFNPQILSYLNTVGATKGLQAKLEAAAGKVKQPLLTAQVIDNVDITGDGKQDLLVSLDIVWGAYYEHLLNVYSCNDRQFILLNSLQIRQPYDISGAPGMRIEAIVDLNGNHLPEIVMREGYVQQKMQQAISIFEWNKTELTKTFTTGYWLGFFGMVRFQNIDHNFATLELSLENFYAYGQATAAAVIELSSWRPIIVVYQWVGDTWSQYCQYFTDTPSTLFETLHSAESYRACGNFEDAKRAYERMLNEPSLERWTYPFSLADGKLAPNIVAEMEQSYLYSFADYRLMQLALNSDDVAEAAYYFENLRTGYQKGQRGFQHLAMATALLDSYKQTHNLEAACKAAKVAYDAARGKDDPGIPYFKNPGTNGESDWHTGFYYDNGKLDSSDPDDIFNVPSDIADMISIPVCLK